MAQTLIKEGKAPLVSLRLLCVHPDSALSFSNISISAYLMAPGPRGLALSGSQDLDRQ